LSGLQECLYRDQPNEIYYARLRRGGKQIWESLQTTDRPCAARLLRDKKNELENVDPAAGIVARGAR
jgi:hypothetical protein